MVCNIKNYAGISEYEREYLVDAVEKKIRVKFPNKAKKILGGKSAKAQELLDEVYKNLTQEFDWSNNNVGNKVKVGGSMISGKEFVCWYNLTKMIMDILLDYIIDKKRRKMILIWM